MRPFDGLSPGFLCLCPVRQMSRRDEELPLSECNKINRIMSIVSKGFPRIPLAKCARASWYVPTWIENAFITFALQGSID